MNIRKILLFVLISLVYTSCFEEIDVEPLELTYEEIFTVQNSIKQVQSYYRFYSNYVEEISTAQPSDWDLAFESAGADNRVLIGWASASRVVKTGLYNFSEITIDFINDKINNSDDWEFDDPAYINTKDSLSLKDWEDGELYIQNRGVESNNYYIIKFVSKNENSYTFKYASAQTLNDVQEAIINRSEGFNYMYYSFNTNDIEYIEPNKPLWDIVFTPYLGWWESATDGEWSPYIQSGALINNENGVRIAHVFDPEILYEDIDSTFIHKYEYTDMKGAIGSNWKLLGAVGSGSIYNMDADKKYILKKSDFESKKIMYFKMHFIDYKLNGKDHYPTVEFKFLAEE